MSENNNKKDGITIMYSINKDEASAFENETEDEKEGLWGKFKKLFSRKETDLNLEEQYSSNDNNDDLVNEIANDQDVSDIKRNIGDDKTFRNMCLYGFNDFKQYLMKLNTDEVTEEEYLYMEKVILSDINDESLDKIMFLIKTKESLLKYEDSIFLKRLPLKFFEQVHTYHKIPKMNYIKSKDYIYNNNLAIYLFQNGLLDENSEPDLEYFKIEDMQKIKNKYGYDYIKNYIDSKFHNTSFLKFSEIKTLIDIGMNPNIVDKMGRNLYWYISDLEELQYLETHDVILNHLNDKGENFLFDYLQEIPNFGFNEKEFVNYVIEKKLNINTINKKGENILFMTARKNIEIFKFLLSLNIIDHKQRNLKGENILFYIEDKKTIDVLIEKYEMSLFVLNNNGESLIFNRNLDTVALLIEMGVSRKIKNNQGKTYLDK